MFHKKTLLTLVALGLILTVGVVSASAFSGNWANKWHNEKSPEAIQNHEAMMEIFENADYNAWVTLVNERPFAEKFADKFTQENFDNMVQMHELKQSGDMEGAKALAEELGWPGKMGIGGKFGHMKNYRFEDKNHDGFCDKLDWELE